MTTYCLTLCLLVFYLIALLALPGRSSTVRAEPSLSSGRSVSDATIEECSVRGGDSSEDLINPCSVRGGDASEGLINEFLSKQVSSLDRFHIHGWRWHTMSLVREAGRLRQLAQRANVDESVCPLEQATDYVIGFNLKGLHKIEADLFFPWMREKLTSIEQPNLSSAFATVMDQLESDRKMVAKLGDSIKRSVVIACDEAGSALIRTQAIESIVEESTTLEFYARSMMERENTLLVPAIAQIVSESEQKSFNTKVLMNLGILDSRLHLVGMHEAVWASNNSQEKDLFIQSIPSIPQMMIPRWKRKLYEPKTNVFDQ